MRERAESLRLSDERGLPEQSVGAAPAPISNRYGQCTNNGADSCPLNEWPCFCRRTRLAARDPAAVAPAGREEQGEGRSDRLGARRDRNNVPVMEAVLDRTMPPPVTPMAVSVGVRPRRVARGQVTVGRACVICGG